MKVVRVEPPWVYTDEPKAPKHKLEIYINDPQPGDEIAMMPKGKLYAIKENKEQS